MLEFQFRHVLCGALTGCSRFINAAEVTVYPRRSQHASPRSSRRALPRGNYMCVRVGMGDYSRFVVGDDGYRPRNEAASMGVGPRVRCASLRMGGREFVVPRIQPVYRLPKSRSFPVSYQHRNILFLHELEALTPFRAMILPFLYSSVPFLACLIFSRDVFPTSVVGLR